MALILSEKQVESLIDMKEVVASVEEAFRRQARGEAANTMRTRSRGRASLLNVMHANLPYLSRGGLKAYMSSKAGTRFVFVLFDTRDSTPLAIMGADALGRFRTGAASGVATRHLYGQGSGVLAVFGSGRQALTQVLALQEVVRLEEVRVWSPTPGHRKAFVDRLSSLGFRSKDCGTAAAAAEGAQIVSTITSSSEPLLTERMVGSVSHANACGSNAPGHSEITPEAVRMFGTVVVDDLPQAKVEYGDLIQAVDAGAFSWDAAVELSEVVAGRRKSGGKTLFKSGGAALEDVAVASAIYDKARKSGEPFLNVELA